MAKNVSIFPKRPFDGMKYTDQWRRKWVYKKPSKSWVFDGFDPNIPLADSNNIGLLKPGLKQFIDSLSEKAGSFGIITDNSFGKTNSNNYLGVLSGDIKLISNSLDIKCNNVINNPEINRYPYIDINFSDDFLDTICVEVPGCQGPKGKKGPKGPKGKDGTGNGPKGERGAPGANAVGISTVSEVEVIFDDSYYNSAITDVRLDEERAILSATRSNALVPDENTPADEVVAQAVVRDIEFKNDESWDYEIKKLPEIADPYQIPLDPILLAYGSDFNPTQNKKLKVAAEGCCCEEADSAEIIAKSFSDYVNQIIDKYKSAITGFNEEFDREVREYIFKKDEEARKALDVLVQKLSDEEFHEKFEYCMSLADNGVCGQQCCNELSKMSQNPYLDSLKDRLEDIANAICGDCSNDNQLKLTAGSSELASNVEQDIIQSYGIPTLSENAAFITPQEDFVRSGSDYNQYNTGICVFASSILEFSGYDTSEASEYCQDSISTKLGTVNLKPNEPKLISTDVGPILKSGSYLIQYRNGTIFDSDNPSCGYVVGSGNPNLGLVIRHFKASNTTEEIEEIEIPWPSSSISTNPLDPSEVEEAYLSGPITEMCVGIISQEGDRLQIEAIANGDRSYGSIEVSITHCSKCLTEEE